MGIQLGHAKSTENGRARLERVKVRFRKIFIPFNSEKNASISYGYLAVGKSIVSVGKIAEKAVCRSVFLTIWHSKLTKTLSLSFA